MKSNVKNIAMTGLLLWLSACAISEDKRNDWTAQQFYNEAKQALEASEFERAIENFEMLEARYPFGRHAQQAQLDIAYAYYRFDEMDSAIAAAERFIRLHPTNPYVDYAYYLKGLANYNRGRSLLETFFPRDFSQLNQHWVRQSFRDFATLVRKFPDSRYSKDAQHRLHYLRNKMAEHELRTAQFYFDRGAWVAAANRSRYLVENYSQTPSVPDALALLADAYLELDMQALAQSALRVLRANAPQHEALARHRQLLQQQKLAQGKALVTN